MTLLLVMLGGAAGAVLRHLASRLLPGSHRIPVATLAVNVAGSFALGALSGAGDALPRAVLLLLGAGFCGALTTWSTFAFQSLDLNSRWWATANVAATLVLGLGAAAVGRAAAL